MEPSANQPHADIWVTVVLICHNDGKWLPKCIESLKRQTIFAHLELIITDNASSDGTDTVAKELIEDWPRASFLPTGGDNGFAYACNRGAEAAKGKYVYFLSPDTWLEPDCLEMFRKIAEQEQAAGAGCTILEYEDNRVQARGSHGYDFAGNPVSPRNGADPDPLFCIAGFAFLRRDFFMRIGMLDQKLFIYCEEVDLAWRTWISGERLVYAKQAKVHHRGAALVNPAGGSRQVENRTSVQKRFLANRNSLVVLAKNCQHVLLLMLVPSLSLVLAEFFVSLIVTRSWVVAKASCLAPIGEFLMMRKHILSERKRIRAIRKHGDFYMLRFFKFGFGRWNEIEKMFKLGLPKVSRS